MTASSVQPGVISRPNVIINKRGRSNLRRFKMLTQLLLDYVLE